MKRFLLDDKSTERLTRTIVVRVSEREYNAIKLKAYTYTKGMLSVYLRAAGKFFTPKRNHLIEEEID